MIDAPLSAPTPGKGGSYRFDHILDAYVPVDAPVPEPAPAPEPVPVPAKASKTVTPEPPPAA